MSAAWCAAMTGWAIFAGAGFWALMLNAPVLAIAWFVLSVACSLAAMAAAS